MTKFIKKFSEITKDDVANVGYKSALLGEMYNHLTSKGILIPDGFAVTADAFYYFINSNNLMGQLNYLMKTLEPDFSNLAETGADARDLIMEAHMPNDLGMAIINAYDYLTDLNEEPVAVRSSANDNTTFSIKIDGFHESYLNVEGHCSLLYSIRQCFASLYSDSAIKYRQDKGMSYNKAFNSIIIQKMVRSDKACSGIGITSYPPDKTSDTVLLSGVWGMDGGHIKTKGIPDEFLIFKPSLKFKGTALIDKQLGTKNTTLVYANEDDESNLTLCLETPITQKNDFIINSQEVEKLANWAVIIEDYFSQPMGFEWAKDGENNQLYILGAWVAINNLY